MQSHCVQEHYQLSVLSFILCYVQTQHWCTGCLVYRVSSCVVADLNLHDAENCRMREAGQWCHHFFLEFLFFLLYWTSRVHQFPCLMLCHILQPRGIHLCIYRYVLLTLSYLLYTSSHHGADEAIWDVHSGYCVLEHPISASCERRSFPDLPQLF